MKQKGFNLIELSLVIAVAAILTVGINLAYTAIKGNIAFNKAIETMEFTFLGAAQKCFNQAGTLVDTICTKEAIISLSKLQNNSTPFGDEWMVMATSLLTSIGRTNANTMTISYPLAGYGIDSEVKALAGRLKTRLSALRSIKVLVDTDFKTLRLHYSP